jgi:amidohydrolase
MPIINRVAEFHDEMTAWRRHLHEHPELAFEEVQTAAFVAEKLRDFGVDEVHTGIAGTGVVGVVRSGSGRRAIGLRADMDALPIHEATGLPHASRSEGKMHACGHDGHTTMLLGAARYLAETRNFDGTVYLIFQPAEELGGGGQKMIEEGLFKRFPAERVFGLHNRPQLPLGRFAMRTGPAMAAVDDFRIRIQGKGCHAAFPHLGRNPIATGCQIAQALEGLVARQIDPLDNAVVSVTRFSAGDAYNVLPETAELWGTVRTFKQAARTFLEQRINEIVKGIVAAGGVETDLHYRRGYPILINSAEEAALAAEAAAEVVGEADVDRDPAPVMGAEDFAFMLEVKLGAYIWMGVGGAEQGKIVHSPYYDFNDEVLSHGVSYWARLVERLLPRG